MIYPLEPIGENATLKEHCNNLKVNKLFCYKNYRGGKVYYKTLEYFFNNDTIELTVAQVVLVASNHLI